MAKHSYICAQLLRRVWLCDPGTIAHQTPLSMGISQARILEWVATSSYRGCSWPRDWTHVSWVFCIGRSHLGSPKNIYTYAKVPWAPAQTVKNLPAMRPGFNLWIGTIPWRGKWQPTPAFLPGESHGQRRLEGYSPWGHTESDTTERLSTHNTAEVPES